MLVFLNKLRFTREKEPIIYIGIDIGLYVSVKS